MAGALVEGAFLSASLHVLFNRMVSRQVLDFFKGQKLNPRLLKKLEIKMITINKFLDDAEDKQHVDLCVKQWLDEVKDAVYEAEDFLDEIASEVQRWEMEAESQTTLNKVKDFASSCSPFKTGKKEKLEEILETLEDLIAQKDALGLKVGLGIGEKPSYQRSPTTSTPDESVTYGREADKEAIMKWVLSEDANDNNPDVRAIVGMGGLGKTTLAQNVYCDDRTDDWFHKKAWVCVSEEFNVRKLTKDILEGFTKESSNINTLDELENRLQDVLNGMRFFLVLDDVWNKDYRKWQDLLKSFISGRKGSKILVTTRDVDVVKTLQTSPAYRLRKLKDDDCWLLFKKHAFSGTGSSSAHPELERIGRQLIEKCDGLPLAAKVLGDALRHERDPKKWRKILASDTWNLCKGPIVAVLKMSYRSLPSHLKRCFAYCAVFPKGYVFDKEHLIRLWMAEGLLTPPKMNIHIEEVENTGEVCFDDLVSRSFFQQSMQRECFLMHDLINDLAKSISGEFCFRIGVDRSCEISERIRHLWVEEELEDEIQNQIFTIKHLRTFLHMGSSQWLDNINDEVMQNFLSTFTRLRVLSLCYYKKIGLPDSIGDLLHLRYLDLSYSSIERLPDSIVSLSNLEILILYECEQLVELPTEISKLINLCELDIRGTEVRKMPPHMGKLKKLGELAYFIVGKESDCSIKELGPLNRLGGHLQIKGLTNVSKVEESVEANLKCKEKLKRLDLIWGDEVSEDSLRESNVLEKLQPHTNIERLDIDGYAGARFPDWVGDSSFSNMVELNLIRCRYCVSLPPLGQLGSLKRLSIEGLDVIKVVGPEFYGNGNKPSFGRLQYLRFERMLEWEEWLSYTNMDEGGDSFTSFPLLESLVIQECPNLKKIQPMCLPSLTKLEIKGCNQPASLPRAPAIQEFEIDDDYRGMLLQLRPSSWSPRPSLRIYHWHCAGWPLEILEQIFQSPISIGFKELHIKKCDSLTRFPLDLFPMLESLEIDDCPILESLFWTGESQEEQPLRCLKYLELYDCPKLEWHLGCVPSLIELHINECPSTVDWHRLFPNLTKLHLIGNGEGSSYKEVESFPLQIFPSTLTSLGIYDFPNLRSLDIAGFQFLISLTELEISWCPNLQEVRLPPTLTFLKLEISQCTNLREVWLPPTLTSLKLKISGCPNLREVRLPPSLTSLKLDQLENLESLDNWELHLLTSLTQLEINECGKLRSLPREGLPSSLTSVTLQRLENLESLDNSGLHHLTSLTRLNICYCQKLRSLPREGLPSSLISLTLDSLENLESLDNSGLHRITSLTQLKISHCSKLQSLRREGLPSSLQRIDIVYCPLLEVGQDWPFDPLR